MKTWFEVTITNKKRSRRWLILKLAVGTVCSLIVLLIIERYPHYSQVSQSGPRLHVAESQAAISSFEMYTHDSKLDNSPVDVKFKTRAQEQTETLRQIRMHNTLRGVTRRGNSKSDNLLP